MSPVQNGFGDRRAIEMSSFEDPTAESPSVVAGVDHEVLVGKGEKNNGKGGRRFGSDFDRTPFSPWGSSIDGLLTDP